MRKIFCTVFEDRTNNYRDSLTLVIYHGLEPALKFPGQRKPIKYDVNNRIKAVGIISGGGPMPVYFEVRITVVIERLDARFCARAEWP